MNLLLLTLGTFWVQLHGVPAFCMTIIVAKAIGAILGEVLWVDNRDGTYCVGHFIRIHLRFDVTQPLIRLTPDTFPKVGERIVNFKYEYLPENCFACGKIGHLTQVCIDKYELSQGSLTPSLLAQFSSVFVDLEGGTNLRGNSIGSSAQSTLTPSPPHKTPIHSP
ncbi:PREDICTED: reverse mRNAase [Prunus dulcis]|uniref:PREDICTED: reverse mRNAase n=1 Tax=Prunus dulcis TaxID=3755 RepID=A0A5E4GEU4_PRUDU|nr:uncharacterized protein LOC117633994 [Prunus dulcis]KAI5316573.1 hypothetical protein L3X38_036280 [Prunus dulcis]VVA38274.1 PREDICTED: reverse mRNAase [Prunus dulcis]